MGVMVEIPAVGTALYVPELNRRNGYEKDNKEICWSIISTETYQDFDRNIRTICTMIALDSEGEELLFHPEKINLDMYDNTDVI